MEEQITGNAKETTKVFGNSRLIAPIIGYSRQAHNLKVLGSNPSPATNLSPGTLVPGFYLQWFTTLGGFDRFRCDTLQNGAIPGYGAKETTKDSPRPRIIRRPIGRGGLAEGPQRLRRAAAKEPPKKRQRGCRRPWDHFRPPPAFSDHFRGRDGSSPPLGGESLAGGPGAKCAGAGHRQPFAAWLRANSRSRIAASGRSAGQP